MRIVMSVGVAMALVSWQSCVSPLSGLRFQVQTSQLVNSVYHVACLGGSIACSREVFERFWQERMGWTADDQAELS